GPTVTRIAQMATVTGRGTEQGRERSIASGRRPRHPGAGVGREGALQTATRHAVAMTPEDVAQARAHLQGCRADLLSECDDAAQAVAAARRGGPCVTMGVLQARLDAGLAELAGVQVALATLDQEG